MSTPTARLSLIIRAVAGQLSASQLVHLFNDEEAAHQRRHAAAVRRANKIDREIAKLKREMEQHCSNPHGNGRRAELIHFDLTVRLAERDRLSRAVPTLDDALLDQLADDYDAADARKNDQAEPAHITLPDDADPAAVAETIKAALDRGVSG